MVLLMIEYSTYELITSLQNTRVKNAVKLRQRRDRDRSQTFLIEGYRELLRALEGNMSVTTLFICPEFFLGENEGALISRITEKGAEIIRCTEQVFQKLSYRDRPDGLLAIAPQLKYTLKDLDGCIKDKAAPFFVVAEAIEKPGNLGTILRSADAVGVDGVIICDRCTDIHNPNVVRASTGTLFTRPVVEATSDEVMEWLKERNVSMLAATPAATKEFTEVDLTGPVAVVLGTEQYGLSEKWMNGANCQVRIPMMGVADSLNVAMATSLLLYEVLRQRRL
ncbi:MAG: TrmH family RNA methyltransferase [Chlamydiales bacterium]|jgi:TrmH family RNA methyltransferase